MPHQSSQADPVEPAHYHFPPPVVGFVAFSEENDPYSMTDEESARLLAEHAPEEDPGC